MRSELLPLVLLATFLKTASTQPVPLTQTAAEIEPYLNFIDSLVIAFGGVVYGVTSDLIRTSSTLSPCNALSIDFTNYFFSLVYFTSQNNLLFTFVILYLEYERALGYAKNLYNTCFNYNIVLFQPAPVPDPIKGSTTLDPIGIAEMVL